MNKVEIIKGIEKTMEGLDMLKNALREVDSTATVEKEVEAPKKVAPKKEKEVVETPQEVGSYNIDELNAMKYNEFKKFASSLGVKCTGTRDEIMQRILDLGIVDENVADENVVEEDNVEPTKEVEETKSVKSKPSKKLGKKKVEEEVAPKDEFDDQAEEIAKDTDVEEIIEALADVDIKANKKNAVSLLAKALREGLIELDDEEEEEVVAEDSIAEAIEADSYFPQYDPEGYNDPKNMTEDRAEAIETKMDEILTSISEGKITEDDITSYIEDNATEDEIELLGEDYDEDELIKMYMELVKRTIDNEGVEHEPSDPYEVGDRDLCCGHTLQYVKKSKKYICSQCGEEYEAE